MAAQQLSWGSPSGVSLGQSATDLVSFYNGTPRAQPAGAAQTALTDLSTGTANPATGVALLSGTYNSTLLINAFATFAAAINALRSAMVSVNLIKGSA